MPDGLVTKGDEPLGLEAAAPDEAEEGENEDDDQDDPKQTHELSLVADLGTTSEPSLQLRELVVF